VQKDHKITFGVFLDIRENAEWPRFWPLCIFANIKKTTKDNYMIFAHTEASVLLSMSINTMFNNAILYNGAIWRKLNNNNQLCSNSFIGLHGKNENTERVQGPTQSTNIVDFELDLLNEHTMHFVLGAFGA